MLVFMKKAEIEHLATLARIKLTESEMVSLGEDLSSIVEYVSTVNDIADDAELSAPQVGARFNIFRADETTNQPNQYTTDIMAEMPTTDGRFMSVKKIMKSKK